MSHFLYRPLEKLFESLQQDYKKLTAELRWKDWLFLLCTIPIMIASIFMDSRLFKLGIPVQLPGVLGSLPGPDPLPGHEGNTAKLFLFEIYLFCVLVLFGWEAIKNIKHILNPALKKNQLACLTVFFVFVAFLQFLISRPENLLLAIRNAAFAWYFILPLILLNTKIPQIVFTAIAKICAAATVAIFVESVINRYYIPEAVIDWHPHIGAYAILLYWFSIPSIYTGILLAALGLGLAFDAAFNFQRTSLMGFCLTAVFLFFYLPKQRKNFFLGAFIIIAALTANYVYLKIEPSTTQLKQSSAFSFTKNAFTKSESNKSGLEVFRWSMWNDAFGLFKEKPFTGIGFERQVVFRVYKWSGIYVPNDEHWMKNADAEHKGVSVTPIAGPHNSYLNAITRIGIAGVLILIIHIWALVRFINHKLLYPAIILLGQMIYAFFNVGLEGPARSALLLIMLGLALRPDLKSRQSRG